MIEIPIEDMLSRTGSIFKLVNLASKRTAELTEGYAQKIETPGIKRKAIIALHEISNGKIQFTIN
ncbi:MAG: DNA-directed RNA polymerase subunit omega [Candidatus Omnitrophota bacterium]